MGEGGEEGSVRSLRTDEAGVRQRAEASARDGCCGAPSSPAPPSTRLFWIGVSTSTCSRITQIDSNYLFELNGRIRTSMEGSR